MAQISGVPFNPSNASSAIRGRDQAPLAEPPEQETEEVQNEEQGQGQSTASVERAAQQAERSNIATESRNDAVQAENRRDQIVEDVIESQEQGPSSPSALGGLDEANPSDDNPEDVSASPTEVSRNQNRQDSDTGPGVIENKVSEGKVDTRVEDIRNERANVVAQDRLRSFETRKEEKIGGGSNAEVNEAVTSKLEEARVTDKPAFDVPEQRVNEAGATGQETSTSATNKQAQDKVQESEAPQRPADAQTERGLNIDQLI